MIRLWKMFMLCAICAVLSASAAHAGDRSVALVLDASGSMKAALPDGQTRIDAAKAAVSQLVTTLAPETRLSFRAYGHQSPTAKKDCKDTSLLTSFDAVTANKAVIVEQARSLQPRGYTPITYALTLAAQDLSKEEAASRVVVLVSDGKETCEADPCAAAKALADADAKLVVHTIGIGVDAVTRGQLQCVAHVARGSYFDANSAVELAAVLGKAAVTEADELAKKRRLVVAARLGKLKMKGQGLHRVINAAGKEVGALNQIQTEIDLASGFYSVTFGKQSWPSIEIRAGETTEIKPGYLEIKPLGSNFAEVLEPETAEPIARMLWNEPRIALIPGRYNVSFGQIPWPGGIEVEPGKTTTLKPGVLNIQSKATMYFLVKDVAGKEQEGAQPGRTSLALPAGRYVLEIDSKKFIKSLTDDQRKMDIEIVAGEELNVKVD